MSTIIVGNGGSLLNKHQGSNIDTFDNVVRFNAFETKGYEPHVGSKTDIWFSVMAFTENSWRFQQEYKEVYWHSWQWDVEKDKHYHTFKKHLKDREIIKTKRDTILQIQNYVDNKVYFPYSTGALATWMLLEKYDEPLYMTGFDWWQEGVKHHYSDNAPKGTLHKPEIEYVLFKKLESDKKIIFLP